MPGLRPERESSPSLELVVLVGEGEGAGVFTTVLTEGFESKDCTPTPLTPTREATFLARMVWRRVPSLAIVSREDSKELVRLFKLA
jgi:hypothetical protein